MSIRQTTAHARSASAGGNQPARFYVDDSGTGAASRTESAARTVPEGIDIAYKLLPTEKTLPVHVRKVEYSENGCEHATGTLYITTFRLIFMPDKEMHENRFIRSGNRYIDDYDIPLTSICRINIAPLEARSGFKSFLNENQIQSETRKFTVTTRDFRRLTFAKRSVTKSQSLGNQSQTSGSRMEAYINTLEDYCRISNAQRLYFYTLTRARSNGSALPRSPRIPPSSPSAANNDISDCVTSVDERIRSYMTYQDWRDELHEAGEEQWTVNQTKFDYSNIVQDEGPYVHQHQGKSRSSGREPIWHWTHASAVEIDSRPQATRRQVQYTLTTMPGVIDTNIATDSLRRDTTDSGLTHTSRFMNNQVIQQYNLARFPCSLKRLQSSFDKLMEICVIAPDDDDEKWLSKLHACKWLKYVSTTLRGAVSLAKLLNFRHVQLAGSDLDNSCLLSSLIQILLRPRCRTIQGFGELIVREWIIRGHPFRERFGQAVTDVEGATTQEAPVFLLFLDCVHQLIDQNPFAFEFTEYFLLELYRDVCYGYQHTFAFNSVLERRDSIQHRSPHTLVLSAFDFSLYLRPDAQRLLKNYAFLYIPPRSWPTSEASASGQSTARKTYRLENPKPPTYSRQNSTSMTVESCEYEAIEAPQKFINNLQVDWRPVNIVVWSRCYCRYDQDYLPMLGERQMAFDISRLKDAPPDERTIPPAIHPIAHANSWYSSMPETRV